MLCLQEGLSYNAVPQRLGLPSSSLARWVRQARIDLGQAAPRAQGLLTSCCVSPGSSAEQLSEPLLR